MSRSALFSAYLRQQLQLSVPDPVLSRSFKPRAVAQAPAEAHRSQPVSAPELRNAAPAKLTPSVYAVKPAEKIPQTVPVPSDSFSKLSRLKPISPVVIQQPVDTLRAETPKPSVAVSPGVVMSYDEKRAALAKLYVSKCDRCHLSKARHSFVFGAGNAGAPVMVIGEAPGADEDQQGLPFVGKAGQLLTDMLKAIKLDRKNDVFITNILKCRPPGNRNPESAEILACMPILEKQIEIIQPRVILLLGRIAAHAVLGFADSIAKLRTSVYDYQGIPAIVTYHPAALLRSSEYKRPAWEDLQKLQKMIQDQNFYGQASI